MDRPLISIITITYNAADTLPPTMDSVGRQDFRDFEHIIIDGASTDDTLAIARSGSHVPIIVSEPDKGIYDAMNKGLRLAKGKYLLFLNAGDAFSSNSVLGLYAAAAAGNPDIIYADTRIVGPDRKFLSMRHLSAPERLTPESFANGMLVCHQAFMVRRGIAPQYNTSYRLSADYDWTIRCIKAANPDNCINLNTVAIDYLSEGATIRNHRKSLMERFGIMCSHYGTLPTILRHFRFALRALNRKISGI